jgi:hypothetical protein
LWLLLSIVTRRRRRPALSNARPLLDRHNQLTIDMGIHEANKRSKVGIGGSSAGAAHRRRGAPMRLAEGLLDDPCDAGVLW